jgi:hypothetical protein
MSAPHKLINLYIASYKQLFPTSRILLLTSKMSDIFVTPTSTYQSSLLPSLALLQSTTGKIVGAVYSNGGAFGFTNLARLYAAHTGRPLPLDGLLLDSAPGSAADLASGQRAILASIPPFLRRAPARVFVIFTIQLCFILYRIMLRWTGRVDPITTIRADLLDGRLLRKGGQRAYIFGEEDVMVPAGAVVQHAQESERAGWTVRRELWKGSGHVAHARADKERYWAVVRGTLGS